MAGSISLSLSQQFDELGEPLNGGLLYTFAAGTTTPQSAYQDYSLTLPWPNPIVLDSAGRVPAFYLADGQIKIRLSDANGVTQVAADNILVVGASAGTGTPPTVDATTVFSTGDLKARYGTGAHTGWVRCNGRTIGSASSGASESAAADCQDLFEFLWTTDANLTVSTGRGASANADWVANKTIALPDWRGRAIAGLDDMGASAAGRLTATYFGTAATVLGAAGGTESHQLIDDELPDYTLPAVSYGINVVSLGNYATGGGTLAVQQVQANTNGNSTTSTNPTSGGSDDPHNNASPMMLTTIYIKL